MIANFGNTYLFILFLVGCVVTPAFYSYKLWEAKSIFKKYNIDESATQVQRFAAAWPMAESMTAILLIYFGPQGNWAFFIIGIIVFTANLIYNSGAYFNVAFTLGRGKYKVTPEAVIASVFKFLVYLILIIGLRDIIFV